VRKLILSELLHNIRMPDERFADAILLAETHRHTATGTAVAYCVEITATFNDGID
jgi:hypothetical protein